MRRPAISHRSFARPAAISADRTCSSASAKPTPGLTMTDLLLLALGVGVFGLMAAYAIGCERV
jgi:hypothetical protein